MDKQTDMCLEEYAKHQVATYAGYVTDRDELMECTSGGIATALSRHVLESGGYVVGVSYSSDYMSAKYEIIDDVKELDRFKGSKYVEADTGNIYADVRKLLDDGQNVLFFGLPCVVAAVRTFLKKSYENLITVELICAGPTTREVHQQYVAHLEKIYRSDIVDFSVRKKLGAWMPPYLYAKFADGRTFSEEFYETEYGYAFTVLRKQACLNCRFRGNARVGDIMLGDFWGASKKDEFWNEGGVSAILVHTERGDEFLNSVSGIKLYETTFERIVSGNMNVINPAARHPDRERFEKILKEQGLFSAVSACRSRKQKVKRLVKKVLPRKVLRVLRRC